jgi:hypothetical protein
MKFVLDDGWKRWERAITPSIFSRELRKNLKVATKRNGLVAVRTIRKVIRSGSFQDNAPLTVMIKSSSKPLVDRGSGLFQAITHKMVDDVTVFAGVLMTSGEYNIAIAIHQGATIRVTPKMRGMFFNLWLVSEGELPPGYLKGRARELWERHQGDWLPLKSDTRRLVIPSRPFIKDAFNDTMMKHLAFKNWENAIKKTMKRLAKGA